MTQRVHQLAEVGGPDLRVILVGELNEMVGVNRQSTLWVHDDLVGQLLLSTTDPIEEPGTGQFGSLLPLQSSQWAEFGPA